LVVVFVCVFCVQASRDSSVEEFGSVEGLSDIISLQLRQVKSPTFCVFPNPRCVVSFFLDAAPPGFLFLFLYVRFQSSFAVPVFPERVCVPCCPPRFQVHGSTLEHERQHFRDLAAYAQLLFHSCITFFTAPEPHTHHKTTSLVSVNTFLRHHLSPPSRETAGRMPRAVCGCIQESLHTSSAAAPGSALA